MSNNNTDTDRIRLQRVTKNLLEATRFTIEQQQKIDSKALPSASTVPVAASPPSEEIIKKQSEVPSAKSTPPVEAVANGQQRQQKRSKPRAAIVAWDLSHNPAGRALVLYRLLEKDYTVDLVGPLWSRFGRGLWQPLRNLGLNVRSFLCSDIESFVPKAEFIAHEKTYDLVYVSKPRLPSLFLGKLISLNSQCPLIVDVDDFELSFFPNEDYADVEEVIENPEAALREPYEELATRYCQTLVSAADAVTVSNIALKRKFGGQMIRHARDESDYSNVAQMRESGRIRLNVSENAYLLLFVGTPRPHKGILEVARAIYEINDRNIVFHVVGTISDQGFRNQLKQYDCPQIVFHNNCDFSELPELIAAADLVPLIQDVSHPISQFQIPAKISDATSLGVPVLATRTPPVEDMILSGGVIETTLTTLKEDILKCASKECDETRREIRSFFNDELGNSVNRTRLKMVVSDIDWRESSYDDVLSEMVRVVRNTYASLRGQSIMIESMMQVETGEITNRLVDNGVSDKKHLKFSAQPRTAGYQIVRSPGSQKSGMDRLKEQLSSNLNLKKILRYNGSYDIAFFWKQNDSGLYGRRSDMVAKYLANSGRVRSLVHFDAPLERKQIHQYLNQADEKSVTNQLTQQELVIRNLYDRQLQLFDSNNRINRTYISPHPKAHYAVGSSDFADRSYSNYVRKVLLDNGMRPESTIAWFCPVVWEAPQLIRDLNFGAVVSDLIDDQRAWSVNNEIYYNKLNENYRSVLSNSHLVFANCESLANTFVDLTDEIHVVPNAAECLLGRSNSMERRFSSIDKPIVGYVGNLRDRIDWILLHKVVTELSHFHFVFIGPEGDSKNAQTLAKHANVEMLGVVPYDEMVGCLGEFDAAIVPHLNNHLTAKMNPLKVYNYFAAGVPVVSTEVANLADFGSNLVVASSTESFINAIRDSVPRKINTESIEWNSKMKSISWSDRVDTIMDVMDLTIGTASSRSWAGKPKAVG